MLFFGEELSSIRPQLTDFMMQFSIVGDTSTPTADVYDVALQEVSIVFHCCIFS